LLFLPQFSGEIYIEFAHTAGLPTEIGENPGGRYKPITAICADLDLGRPTMRAEFSFSRIRGLAIPPQFHLPYPYLRRKVGWIVDLPAQSRSL